MLCKDSQNVFHCLKIFVNKINFPIFCSFEIEILTWKRKDQTKAFPSLEGWVTALINFAAKHFTIVVFPSVLPYVSIQ